MTAPTSTEPLDQAFEDALATLTDRRESVAPISPDEHRARRTRLADALRRAGDDALFCEGGGTLRWLVGFDLGRSERFTGLVSTADDRHFLVAPAFEESRVAALADAAGLDAELVTWDEHEHALGSVSEALASARVRTLAIEPDVRTSFAGRLEELASVERVRCARGLPAVLRARKDEHERALLARANELTQQAIRFVFEHLRPGLKSSQIASRLHRAQTALGLRNIWDLSLIGPAGAFPHGDGVERELNVGDVLLVDTGGSLHGYQSDNTRTILFGAREHAAFERAWHAVRDAQLAVLDTLAEGVELARVDDAARGVIAKAGYGDGYRALFHRVGHGIGVEGHEAPYLDGGSTVRAEVGMTFSNEPGIYLPGEFGVRIEDIIEVGEDGARAYGSPQPSPLEA